MLNSRFSILLIWSLISFVSAGHAQIPVARQIRGHVVDAAGLAVPYARVSVGTTAGTLATLRADAAGAFVLELTSTSTATITANSEGMQSAQTRVDPANPAPDLVLTLKPLAVEQQVSVTTTRASVAAGPGATTVSALSSHDLTNYPALTSDERLRQHAGFELFRRSSGWVANPTSEGISLRGLGSTAASRTLVLLDSVPLNDPFGGWIHWNEFAPETIQSVVIASGGGSDLYGSSALAGVIDVVPAAPGSLLLDLDLAEASEDTTPLSGRVDAKLGRWDALAAGESFRTAGYIVTAPGVRGIVDTPSNVHFQNGHVELDRALPHDGRAFLIANLLNEARDNGTPLQTNGTRLWRYIGGDDWSASSRIGGRVRAFGSDEAYRQTFSSVNASRSFETLTRLQNVHTQELGGSADASFQLGHIAFVTGADVRDLRATDVEVPIVVHLPSGLQDTSARQRFLGGFGELLAEHRGWSGAASLRIDDAANLDRLTLSTATQAPATVSHLSDKSELVFSPRVGLVRQLPRGFELHGSAFRAFRTPTMNELYRTGQVGQETTLANSSLVSERATGVEAGAAWSSAGDALTLKSAYFWTEINRPVSAVLISQTAAKIINRRENLGQIQSQGVDVQAQLRAGEHLTLNLGYQYAHAVVTQFQTQPGLVGLWIPQVPRNSATAQLRYQAGARTSFTLAARESGRAFDDSSNIYELHSFFVLGIYAQREFSHNLALYTSLQNLLNRRIETARTPNLTLGTPFVAQGGVRLHWGSH